MKKLIYLITIIALILLSCNQHRAGKKEETKLLQDISPADTTKINVSTVLTDTIFFRKNALDSILVFYPELKDINERPDIIYAKLSTPQLAFEKGFSFSSEVGEDSFFTIYAYYLKQQNKNKHQDRREKLVKLYRYINHIYMRLRSGGTYFGHMNHRILGYAEYSLSIFNYQSDSYELNKYDISSQKKLYISLLKQYIKDEIGSNMEITDSQKPVLNKELLQTVDELSGLITDEFYLAQVQEFQHSNY